MSEPDEHTIRDAIVRLTCGECGVTGEFGPGDAIGQWLLAHLPGHAPVPATSEGDA